MSSPPSSSDPARELEVLRRRAYGPEADIAADPGALERLRMLEDAARGREDREAPVPPATPDDVPVPPGRPDPGGVDEVPAPSAADVAVPPAAHPSRSAVRRAWWQRHRQRALIVGGVLAAAIAAAGFVLQIAPPGVVWLDPVDSTPRQQQRLITQGFGYMSELDVGQLQRHTPLHGLTPWTFDGERGSRCLLIESLSAGIYGASCVPPGLDPIMDVMGELARVVDGERLPSGSIVRFTVDGDRVAVTTAVPLPEADGT